MDENFIVDFGEVTRVTTEDFNKLNNRPSYAGELMTGDTDIPQVPSSVSELNNDSNYQTGAQVSEAIETEKGAREAADTALDGRLTTVEGIAATALQPSSIDKVVMTDINVGANTSTTTFNLDASKQNLLTGATSSKQVSMPVASSTEAGIMNSATFDAVVNNTANINALINGAVAITGLPSSPTQAQLTTAWENATGETSLMNRAGIYDVTNGKVWTYYTNDTTWHSTTNTTQVTINTFTNSSEGTIKGSTNVGQIFAEADGTGSVNGWDALNDAVENNSSDISDLQTAVDGKQDKLIAGANINIAADGKTISATDTTYTAGNAIDITNGEISADIHPADFFTASDSVSDCGSNLSLDNTIATKLKSVELKGDTFQQTYSGKNLLRNTFNSPSTVSGVTFTKNPDGTITANGTATEGLNFYPNGNDYYPISEGTYTLSDGLSNPTSTTYFTYIDTNTSTPNYIYFNTAEGAVTRTLSEGTTIKPRIVIRQGQTLDNVVFKLMLEQGSTATSFEPYVGGIPAPNPDYPQDVQVVTGEQTVIVSGKNLFDKVAEVATSPNYSLNPDGSITTNASNAQTGRKYMTLTMSPGTYTLSFRPYFSGVENPAIRFTIRNLDASTDYIVKNINNPENGSLQVNSFTVENTTSVGFCIIPQARLEDGQTFYFYDTQLEVGSTATAYEPYQSQSYTIDLGDIELCKIGDYRDKIFNNDPNEDWYDPDLEDNAWYVHKEVGIYTLDGTESWTAAAIGDGFVFYTTVITDYAIQNNVPISKYFIGASNVPSYSGTPRNSIAFIDISGQTTPRLYVRYTDNFSSVNEIRAFMVANKPNIYYVLATPTDTKITDATLVTQLNALAGAKSYNNQTNVLITAAGENLPATLCVGAYQKSLNGLLGAIERLGA